MMPVNKMLIEAYLKKLKMPQAAKTYEALAREAADNNLDYEEYLLCVLEQEVHQRENNRIQRGIRQAGFPVIKTLESFDVKATADEVKILYKGTIIASHPRIYGRNQEHITLDHYLELLLQKSRALGNTKVYKPQTLAPIYEQYRRSLNARSQKGNREFVRILMLHRDYPPALVTEAVETAMAYNVYSYDGVLNILGQLLVSGSPKMNPVSKDKLRSIPEVVVIPPDLSKYSVLMPGGGQ